MKFLIGLFFLFQITWAQSFDWRAEVIRKLVQNQRFQKKDIVKILGSINPQSFISDYATLYKVAHVELQNPEIRKALESLLAPYISYILSKNEYRRIFEDKILRGQDNDEFYLSLFDSYARSVFKYDDQKILSVSLEKWKQLLRSSQISNSLKLKILRRYGQNVLLKNPTLLIEALKSNNDTIITGAAWGLVNYLENNSITQDQIIEILKVYQNKTNIQTPSIQLLSILKNGHSDSLLLELSKKNKNILRNAVYYKTGQYQNQLFKKLLAELHHSDTNSVQNMAVIRTVLKDVEPSAISFYLGQNPLLGLKLLEIYPEFRLRYRQFVENNLNHSKKDVLELARDLYTQELLKSLPQTKDTLNLVNTSTTHKQDFIDQYIKKGNQK